MRKESIQYILLVRLCSNVEVIPVNFYVDEEDEEDSDFVDEADCLASDDDFDDDVIFDEKDGDVEVEVKVINEKADGKEEEKPEKEESDDDTEETETINLEEV